MSLTVFSLEGFIPSLCHATLSKRGSRDKDYVRFTRAAFGKKKSKLGKDLLTNLEIDVGEEKAKTVLIVAVLEN